MLLPPAPPHTPQPPPLPCVPSGHVAVDFGGLPELVFHFLAAPTAASRADMLVAMVHGLLQPGGCTACYSLGATRPACQPASLPAHDASCQPEQGCDSAACYSQGVTQQPTFPWALPLSPDARPATARV